MNVLLAPVSVLVVSVVARAGAGVVIMTSVYTIIYSQSHLVTHISTSGHHQVMFPRLGQGLIQKPLELGSRRGQGQHQGLGTSVSY